jgi:hypothetical protein
VRPDPDYAALIIERVCEEECDLALVAAVRNTWTKVNTLTYEARKAVEALLLATGWRVRSAPGAHAAVSDVVTHWLHDRPDPAPRSAARFAASRKARHDDEYPHPNARLRSEPELRSFAQDNVRLLKLVRKELGLTERADLIPTEANLRKIINFP